MAYKVHAGPAELPNPLMREGFASAATLPGKVVVKNGNDLDIADETATGQLLFVKEAGPGEGGKISDAFASGDQMEAYVARQGLYFRARLVTGQALVEGETLLERAASGRLTVVAAGVPVAVARTTVTTGADDELVLVEVL
ncbi:hypothetical protein [Vibrio phage LP.1]|nr:hypothetical protein [Vibrio phage LP.1]